MKQYTTSFFRLTLGLALASVGIGGSPSLSADDCTSSCCSRDLWITGGALGIAALTGTIAGYAICHNRRGKTGRDGRTGIDGPQGQDGKPGTPGTPGIPGCPGEQGEIGPAGPSGPTGATGDPLPFEFSATEVMLEVENLSDVEVRVDIYSPKFPEGAASSLPAGSSIVIPIPGLFFDGAIGQYIFQFRVMEDTPDQDLVRVTNLTQNSTELLVRSEFGWLANETTQFTFDYPNP